MAEKLYPCDPSKNKECNKRGCFINGGPCRSTTHAEYCDASDLISRTALTKEIKALEAPFIATEIVLNRITYAPTIEAEQPEPKWIPVTERLPERDKAVLLTYVNHEPMSYYADIKGVPFTAVGVWHGIWHWWSVVCEDYLLEYGRNEADEMDEDIEVIAWMPLPKPYKADEVEE